MTPASVASKSPPQTSTWLNIVTIWHAVLALAALAGVILIWGGSQAIWLRLLVSVLLVLMALSSAAAIPLIRKRVARGRTLSLTVNYLGFLAALFSSLQRLGVFTGIDSLGDTFKYGVPYLGGLLAGYLISAIGDRYENYPARQKAFHRLGQVVMLVSLAAGLFAVGLLNGLLSVLSRLSDITILGQVLATLLFGFMLWAMNRQSSAEAMHANNASEETISGWLFLSPNLLGFLFFFAGPLILSLYFSFTNWDAFGTRDWVGLDNYAKLFNLSFARLASATQPATEAINTAVYDELARFGLFGQNIIIGAQDKLFWLALRNTIVFGLMAIPIAVIPALLLANMLNAKLPGMKFFRAVYFLPSVAAVVGVALIWQWLYNAAVGFINYFVTAFVTFTNTVTGLTLLDPQVRWLSDTRTALLAVVIMWAWQYIGLNTVTFLAGLQNIPGELYEAATVDGAGRVQKFFYVTLPLLAPTTFFVITTALIQAFQLFEHVYVLIPTEPPGGPNNSTLTLVLYLYQKGFQRFEQGYASAVAWVLFLVIFAATLYQFQRQRGDRSVYGS